MPTITQIPLIAGISPRHLIIRALEGEFDEDGNSLNTHKTVFIRSSNHLELRVLGFNNRDTELVANCEITEGLIAAKAEGLIPDHMSFMELTLTAGTPRLNDDGSPYMYNGVAQSTPP